LGLLAEQYIKDNLCSSMNGDKPHLLLCAGMVFGSMNGEQNRILKMSILNAVYCTENKSSLRTNARSFTFDCQICPTFTAAIILEHCAHEYILKLLTPPPRKRKIKVSMQERNNKQRKEKERM
jgi:glutamine amidotransferase PdxT